MYGVPQKKFSLFWEHVTFHNLCLLQGSEAQKQRPHKLYECCDLTKIVYLWYIDAVIKVLCNDGNDMNKELFLRTLQYVYSSKHKNYK